MNSNSKIAIIGNGSWATALAKILAEKLDSLNWFIRKDKTIEYIKDFHHNPKYLSSVEFDVDKINLSSDINTIVSNSDILIFAKPAAYLQLILNDLTESLEDKVIVSAIKGLIPELDYTISQFFTKKFNIDYRNIAVISGPSHAEEIALERLSYLTIASENEEIAKTLSGLLKNRYVKTIISEDVTGIEYASILKNIFAIAAGIAKGFGLGDNFQSVLVANAHKEMSVFLEKINHYKRDINQSVYLGDLLVTAYSQFSRNRTFGTMIGQGYSVKSVQLEMDLVAEGYFAVRGIHEINEEFKLFMPITEMVYNVLYNKKTVEKEIKKLSEILL